MLRACRPALLLCLGLAILAACTSLREGTVQEVPREAAKLRVFAPAFAGIEGEHVVYQSPIAREEHVRLTEAGAADGAGDGARAELVYIEARRFDTLVAAPPRLRAPMPALRTWPYNKTPIELTGPGRELLSQGRTLRYRPYRHQADGRDCLALYSRWDRRLDDFQRRPAKLLFGYYCAAPGDILTPAEQARIAQSILIVRAPDAPLPDAGGDPTVVAEAGEGDGGMVAQPRIGHPGFPFGIVRHFSPIDGDADAD